MTEINIQSKVKPKNWTITRWIMILLVLLIILNRAWMSDDAYITLRTVDNFIHGYGLTWNVSERVEVYTHPLWMLILSFFYFFTHEAYLTTIFISLGLTLFTLIYVQSKIKQNSIFFLVFLVFGLSNAFVDFATSGLENVLNYVLFSILFFLFFGEEKQENYFKIVFIAGLIGMTRLDLLLMILPVLVYVFFQQSNKWQAIKTGLIASIPLIAWEIFSYIYYGYMFPNTFYAKLYSGTPAYRLLLQGVYYIIASIQRDPLTVVVIMFGLVYGLLNKSLIIRLWGVGLLIYLAYIIKIGGDFMVGRFLTIPLLVSVLILSQTFIKKLNIPKILVTATLVVVLGFVSPMPTYMQTLPDGYLQWFQGVSDEREMYFRASGLLRNRKFNTNVDLGWVEKGKINKSQAEKLDQFIVVNGTNGFYGYFSGPKVYIVDDLALGSAFLAHQPIVDYSDWRIGHFRRNISIDYIESIKHNKNMMKDNNLSKLFEDVLIRTQVTVFNKERMKLLFFPFI